MVQTQVSKSQSDNVIYEVVEKIAEVEDVDPLELTPPLRDVIDPDALTRIISTKRTAGRTGLQVTFSHSGHEVTVRSGGDVSVEE